MIPNNYLIPVIALSLLFGASKYDGSTKAAVTLAGGILKAKHVVDVKKYKRKDCPVCKGTGWYISGDGIKKVECGYCEPDKELFIPMPPTVLKSNPNCENNNCPPRSTIIRK